MKSPLYILTALLPLAMQVVNASPTAPPNEAEDSLIEERDNIQERDSCRVDRNEFSYYRYPCGSSERTGRARRGDNVEFICKYRDWYRTPNGWVREDEKPRRCRGRSPRRC
ncbi:hypothetical protein BDV29DRAFT_182943 [Aspergillus leporis]|uniref:Chitin-binding type-2 domain-containing protein n=1 Tax=Aspergillus leporis TaxID=41062 RepID=A0A5N5WNJ6_9EURO|nr:hypothetical protein BDV29DRAFT_182943 [Aspergillus leporis]